MQTQKIQYDEQQTAAIRDTSSSKKVIIAGAGSGKTTTLTESIIEFGGRVDLKKAVAITFTVAGADVLKERLSSRGVSLAYIGTLQGYCMHLINRKGLAIGLCPPVQIVDEEAENEWIKKERDALRLKTVSLEDIRRAKASPSMNKAGIVARSYLIGLARENAVDFDTMLIKGAELVSMCDVSALFVDEYQDTGPLDQAFYDACKAPFKTFVGDSDQAIYPFRGASVDFIIEAAKTAKVYLLENNYRSGAGIVAAANRLIENNQHRVAKTMRPATGEQGEGRLWKSSSVAEECGKICTLLKQNPDQEYAILTRYNAGVDMLAEFLRASGINVRTRKNESEQWLPEALAAINVLRAVFTSGAELSESATEKWWRGKGNSCADALRQIAQKNGKNLCDMEQGELLAAMNVSRAAMNAIRHAFVVGSYDETTARLLQREANENGHGCVLISTIHGVKGMEFENVVIASVCEECMPGSNNVEDERRLFYVAMTRAKKKLVISSVTSWNQPFSGNVIQATESRFVSEIQS